MWFQWWWPDRNGIFFHQKWVFFQERKWFNPENLGKKRADVHSCCHQSFLIQGSHVKRSPHPRQLVCRTKKKWQLLISIKPIKKVGIPLSSSGTRVTSTLSIGPRLPERMVQRKAPQSPSRALPGVSCGSSIVKILRNAACRSHFSKTWALLGRPFWAKPVLRRFSGPRKNEEMKPRWELDHQSDG